MRKILKELWDRLIGNYPQDRKSKKISKNKRISSLIPPVYIGGGLFKDEDGVHEGQL